MHGGVNFAPYRARFEKLFAGQNVDMREVYPASEGFVAIADRGYGEGLRLNLDHGLFFEFVPLEDLEKPNPRRHWIANVETGINYALVMSTCAGLWAYVIGDTVRFVETSPPRILITGRTTYWLSAFGEHLLAEQIETGVADASASIGADVTDYSVSAVFPEDGKERCGHVYVMEFAGGAPESAQLDIVRQDLGHDVAADRQRLRLLPEGRAHRAARDPARAAGHVRGVDEIARQARRPEQGAAHHQRSGAVGGFDRFRFRCHA